MARFSLTTIRHGFVQPCIQFVSYILVDTSWLNTSISLWDPVVLCPKSPISNPYRAGEGDAIKMWAPSKGEWTISHFARRLRFARRKRGDKRYRSRCSARRLSGVFSLKRGLWPHRPVASCKGYEKDTLGLFSRGVGLKYSKLTCLSHCGHR